MKQMILKINTTGEEETFDLGYSLGKNFLGGEILVLDGDLGSGKTALTKGLAVGIGSADSVTSPTFTVEHIYTGKNLTMYHYDFYRLGELGLMSEELQEVLQDSSSVVVIEWPQASMEIMPQDKLIHVQFSKDTTQESIRRLAVNFPDKLRYIINNLKTEDIK